MTIADKIERKWLLAGGAIAVVILGMAFSQLTDPMLLVVVGVLLNLTGALISVSIHTYQNELFPTHVRGRATGFVYSFGRLGAMFSGFLIAFFLRDFGVAGVFALISGAMLINFFLVAIFGPRTKDRSLEEISH